MIYGLVGIGGFIFGFALACCLVVKHYYIGEMKVNYTDPMKDIYRMQINDFNKIDKSEFVLFKVDRTQK